MKQQINIFFESKLCKFDQNANYVIPNFIIVRADQKKTINPHHGIIAYIYKDIKINRIEYMSQETIDSLLINIEYNTKDITLISVYNSPQNKYFEFEKHIIQIIEKEHHCMEVTKCISIALRNHERTFSEWFRYVDSCSSPDELALYCLSRKHGIHTLVLNKSYIWTTLSNHITRSDDEIIELCGVNLVFLGPARYGILRKIRRPVLQSSSNNITSSSTSSITPTAKSRKTTCHEGGSTGHRKRERSLGQGRGKHPTVSTLTSRKRPQTLSESRSQTYGITAPVTRSLRSGLKPIDYVSLNDGFEDESRKPSKKKKCKSYRLRGAPSATRVVARKNTVSPEAKEPTNKPDIKKSNTLSGIPSQNIPVADTRIKLNRRTRPNES